MIQKELIYSFWEDVKAVLTLQTFQVATFQVLAKIDINNEFILDVVADFNSELKR